MSLSILSLQQNGDLQRIKDKWLGSGVCITNSPDTVKMSLHSYGGLFIVIAVSYVGIILLRCLWFPVNQCISNRESNPRHPIDMEMRMNGNPYAIYA